MDTIGPIPFQPFRYTSSFIQCNDLDDKWLTPFNLKIYQDCQQLLEQLEVKSEIEKIVPSYYENLALGIFRERKADKIIEDIGYGLFKSLKISKEEQKPYVYYLAIFTSFKKDESIFTDFIERTIRLLEERSKQNSSSVYTFQGVKGPKDFSFFGQKLVAKRIPNTPLSNHENLEIVLFAPIQNVRSNDHIKIIQTNFNSGSMAETA